MGHVERMLAEAKAAPVPEWAARLEAKVDALQVALKQEAGVVAVVQTDVEIRRERQRLRAHFAELARTPYRRNPNMARTGPRKKRTANGGRG